MKYLIIFILIIYAFISNAQELNKKINKDSLFKTLINDLPAAVKTETLKEYKSGSEQDQEFLLFAASMPRSNKILLTKNIDSNYSNIINLKSEYSKLIPPNYTVSIEFNPANINFNIKESVDLEITKKVNNETTVSQEWNLEYKSDKLEKMLEMINWNENTLKTIKKLLDDAKCVSIENGEIANIGFSRNGLGKYSYLIFTNDLTSAKIKLYNDKCNYIFYKRNIVLEYEGGAAGPQCFPDK